MELLFLFPSTFVWVVLLIDFAVLEAEIKTCMRLLGAEKVSDLGPKFVSLKYCPSTFFVDGSC